MPNLIVAPHVAWANREALAIFTDQMLADLETFAAGKPRSQVV